MIYPESDMTAGVRAIVLLSGGLDSATVLAMARSENYQCYALSVEYGQRHRAELDAARRVATALGAREHRIMRVDLAGIGGSALTDARVAVPERPQPGIPTTYVPARNTLFLSLALGWAEVIGANDIFVGVNAVDYSVRPPHPGLLMGGPPMKFHEEHPLLANIQQDVPNTDGMEIYDPPVKFGVLVIDQTYVIAGQFALRLDHGDRLQNVSGWKDPEL